MHVFELYYAIDRYTSNDCAVWHRQLNDRTTARDIAVVVVGLCSSASNRRCRLSNIEIERLAVFCVYVRHVATAAVAEHIICYMTPRDWFDLSQSAGWPKTNIRLR